MKRILTTLLAVCTLSLMVAQPQKKSVVIGSMTDRPNALLIVNPENSDQGVLLPQLSTRNRMQLKPTSPGEDGLIVFDSNHNAYYYWSKGKWVSFYTEDPGISKYQSIDPAAFRELKTSSNIQHVNLVIFETDNSFVTVSRNGDGERIIAPVDLPHGAVMEALTIYYTDNDGGTLKLTLQRKAFSGKSDEIIQWESSGASAAVKNTSFTNFRSFERIDLENYTYRIIVEFEISRATETDSPEEARQRLYGIRIKYQE